jgi:hypothetical protein
MSENAGVERSASDCFISYTRDDNRDLFGVVDRIRNDLAGMYAADTGRTLRVFLDRESMGWGDDWRQRIRQAVESATALIPVVTMRYFTSTACSEELLLFYNSAKQLGVTELILPIVIAGAEHIRADDPREEVRIIESRNYENLREAWLAGYDSSQWRTAMARLAQKLEVALGSAETELARREQAPVIAAARREGDDQGLSDGDGNNPGGQAPPGGNPPTQGGGSPTREVDALEIQRRMEEMTSKLEALQADLQEFADLATATLGETDLGSLSPAQQRAVFIRLAEAIGPVSKRLGAQGQLLKNEVAEIDADLRALVEEAEAIGQEYIDPRAMLGDISSLEGVGETVVVMNELVSGLKIAALMNVSLRRALRPAIEGIQAINVAAATVQSWASLGLQPDS